MTTTSRFVDVATSDDEVRERHQQNRVAWNQAAARYREWFDDQLAALQRDEEILHPLEREHLGELGQWCARAVHLQCASGQDTLALWRRGVQQVVGVDISDEHIANAERMAEALGAPARWFRCDVLDCPSEVDGWADLVYTGKGSLVWLHDLRAWAQVIARILAPGGKLYLFDDHPVTWLFDPESEELVYSGFRYFGTSEVSRGWSESYIGSMGLALEQHEEKHERVWPIASVLSAVLEAGLVIEHYGEHPVEYWNSMPDLDDTERGRVPMTFSLIARRTAGGG